MCASANKLHERVVTDLLCQRPGRRLVMSPKTSAPLRLTIGDELKVVVPQPDLDLEALERLRFGRFSVQPIDGPDAAMNTKLAIDICVRRPQWRLSLQTQKFLGIR